MLFDAIMLILTRFECIPCSRRRKNTFGNEFLIFWEKVLKVVQIWRTITDNINQINHGSESLPNLSRIIKRGSTNVCLCLNVPWLTLVKGSKRPICAKWRQVHVWLYRTQVNKCKLPNAAFTTLQRSNLDPTLIEMSGESARHRFASEGASWKHFGCGN